MFHRKKSINISIGLGVWLAILLLTISIGSPMILDTVYAQENTKAIGAVQLESNQPGVLEVSWDAPTETPLDYRINWARVGENFPTWTDLSGNAFPTSSSYTITDLDQGVRYKVKVRARYNGSAGDWSERVEAVVASAPTATATATATATPPYLQTRRRRHARQHRQKRPPPRRTAGLSTLYALRAISPGYSKYRGVRRLKLPMTTELVGHVPIKTSLLGRTTAPMPIRRVHYTRSPVWMKECATR